MSTQKENIASALEIKRILTIPNIVCNIQRFYDIWPHAELLADVCLAFYEQQQRNAEENAKHVDETWLRSIGFKESEGWNGIWLGRLRWIDHGKGSAHFTVGGSFIKDAAGATRGDMLLLLKAFGIPVKYVE